MMMKWKAGRAGSNLFILLVKAGKKVPPLSCLAVARSKRRGRVAIVLADNLKTHTPAGSLLVRSMLTDLKEHLYLVYTPAYDPDANRIEWLWRVSRRVVTHNHQRSDFALLLADVNAHFQALTRTPHEVLCHIGSPFATDKVALEPQTHAA